MLYVFTWSSRVHLHFTCIHFLQNVSVISTDWLRSSLTINVPDHWDFQGNYYRKMLQCVMKANCSSESKGHNRYSSKWGVILPDEAARRRAHRAESCQRASSTSSQWNAPQDKVKPEDGAARNIRESLQAWSLFHHNPTPAAGTFKEITQK